MSPALIVVAVITVFVVLLVVQSVDVLKAPAASGR
jgi:hypothetical protein